MRGSIIPGEFAIVTRLLGLRVAPLRFDEYHELTVKILQLRAPNSIANLIDHKYPYNRFGIVCNYEKVRLSNTTPCNEKQPSILTSTVSIRFAILFGWQDMHKSRQTFISSIVIVHRGLRFELEIFLLHNLFKTELAMKRVRIAWRQWSTKDTVETFMSKLSGRSPRDKNKYNQCYHCRGISEIKLKRTDTTLDLSQ
jgi:hypothetical protein